MRLIPIQARFLGRLLAQHRRRKQGRYYFRKFVRTSFDSHHQPPDRLQKSCNVSTGKA